jgi:hypothetical protein
MVELEDERKPIYPEKNLTIKYISKRLSSWRRKIYFRAMRGNIYRGVIQRPPNDQLIGKFMKANCKAQIRDFLFDFPEKAGNQCLITPFMKKSILYTVISI